MNLDSRLHFAHHLVRLTAYEGLPYRRRTELHARAAEILETALGQRADNYAALLSLHCLHGERYPRRGATRAIAGDQARAQYALAEAAECYRRALTRGYERADASATSEVADVYEALAEVSMDLGEMTEAEQALRHARARARLDPLPLRPAASEDRAAAPARRQARRRGALGQPRPDARSPAHQDEIGRAELRAELAERGALIRYDQGAYRTSMAWAARAVEEARAAGDEAIEARGLGVLVGQSGADRHAASTSRACKQSLELYDKHRRPARQGADVERARRLGVLRRPVGRRRSTTTPRPSRRRLQIGRDFDAAAAAANRAEVLIQQGRIDEAEPVLAPAIRTLVAANATSFLAFAVALRGRDRARAGRLRARDGQLRRGADGCAWRWARWPTRWRSRRTRPNACCGPEARRRARRSTARCPGPSPTRGACCRPSRRTCTACVARRCTNLAGADESRRNELRLRWRQRASTTPSTRSRRRLRVLLRAAG